MDTLTNSLREEHQRVIGLLPNFKDNAFALALMTAALRNANKALSKQNKEMVARALESLRRFNY